MNVPLPTDSSRMGGKLSLLIGIRSLSLLRSRCKNTLILGFMICISYDNVSFMLYAWFNYLTSAEESKMKTEGISVWCCFIAQENLNMFKSRVILLAFSEPAKLWLWVRISSSHPRVKLNPSRIGTHPFFFLRLRLPWLYAMVRENDHENAKSSQNIPKSCPPEIQKSFMCDP